MSNHSKISISKTNLQDYMINRCSVQRSTVELPRIIPSDEQVPAAKSILEKKPIDEHNASKAERLKNILITLIGTGFRPNRENFDSFSESNERALKKRFDPDLVNLPDATTNEILEILKVHNKSLIRLGSLLNFPNIIENLEKQIKMLDRNSVASQILRPLLGNMETYLTYIKNNPNFPYLSPPNQSLSEEESEHYLKLSLEERRKYLDNFRKEHKKTTTEIEVAKYIVDKNLPFWRKKGAITYGLVENIPPSLGGRIVWSTKEKGGFLFVMWTPKNSEGAPSLAPDQKEAFNTQNKPLQEIRDMALSPQIAISRAMGGSLPINRQGRDIREAVKRAVKRGEISPSSLLPQGGQIKPSDVTTYSLHPLVKPTDKSVAQSIMTAEGYNSEKIPNLAEIVEVFRTGGVSEKAINELLQKIIKSALR